MPQPTPVSRELAAECLANWAERNRRKGEKPEQTGRDILQETEEAIVSDAHVRRLLQTYIPLTGELTD